MELYEIPGQSFADLMKKYRYSRTFIASHLMEYHWVFTKLVELSLRDERYMIRLNIGEMDAVLKNVKYQGRTERVSKVVLDDFVRWNIMVREWENSEVKVNGVVTNQFTSTTFRLTDEVKALGFDVFTPDNEAYKVPKTDPIRTEKKLLTGIYRQLEDNLTVVQIDAQAARKYAKECYNSRLALPNKKCGNILKKNRVVNRWVYQSWLRTIEEIESGNMYVHAGTDGTGRFYSTLASCPKALRRFLTINGHPLTELDIRNSQPLVFAILLKRHFGVAMPQSVARFITLCERGEIYQTIRDIVLTQEEQSTYSEREFKNEFFARVFFSAETVKYQWRTRFADEFKEVSDFITLCKKKSYKDLPKALSNLEAELMLHGVAQRLFDAGVTEFLTIHDAIYTIKPHRALVDEIIRDEFWQRGVDVAIKPEEAINPEEDKEAEDARRVEELVRREQAREMEFKMMVSSTPEDFLDNYNYEGLMVYANDTEDIFAD